MKKAMIIGLMFLVLFTMAGCNEAPAPNPVDLPTLKGDKDITLEVGTYYDEQGLKDITEGITITGSVDINVVGDYVISYAYTDETGKDYNITRTIHIVDTTAPVLTIKGNNLSLKVGDTYRDEGVTAIDNYDGVISDITVVDTVDVTTPGTYTISYSATDSQGNTGSAVRSVTVNDVVENSAPVIVLVGAANITIVESDSLFVDPGVTATDAEDGNLLNSVVVVNTVDESKPGTYSITYDVVDSSGLAATTVTRTVVVIKDEVPMITLVGASNITVFLNGAYDELGATAIDNEDGSLSDDILVTGTVDTSTVGAYTVYYNVTDSFGNQAITVERTVVVTTNSLPVITLIGDLMVELYVGEDYVEAGYSATDYEDGDLTSSVTISSTVDESKPGTYTIVYSVKDSVQNITSITRTIVVVVDVAPIITLLGDDVVNLHIDDTYTELGATAFDIEDGVITSAILVTGTVNTSVAGTYTIHYNVNDSAGNQAITVTRTVIVTTNSMPVVTLVGDMTYNLNVGDVFVEPGFSATDLEDGDLTSAVVVSSTVDTSAPGVYFVRYNVTDSNQNVYMISRTIIVTTSTDSMPLLQVDGDVEYTILKDEEFTEPLATGWDFEDGDITDQIVIVNTVDITKGGVYTIEYTLTDNDGNTVSDTISVTVASINLPPSIEISGNYTTYVLVSETFELPLYTASDFEDGDITDNVIVNNVVDVNVVGRYINTYTVTDSEGVTTVVMREINVINDLDTFPVITLIDGNITLKQNRPFVEPGFSAWDDQDGDYTDYVFVDTFDLDVTTPGVYEVAYTITDVDGNFTRVVREVLVVAYTNTDPVITLNGDAIQYIVQGTRFIDPGVIATDNEDGNITSNVIVSGNVDRNKTGNYLITYTVTDEDGVEVSETRTVIVQLNHAPVITLIGESTIFINVFDTYIDEGAIAIDQEDGNLSAYLITNMDDVDTSIPGTYYVQYKVTDTLGKSGYYYRTVVVENNIKHMYGTVVIDQDLPIDLDELFTRLDLTKPADFSLDLSTESVEFKVIDGYGVLFVVTNYKYNNAMFTPDTLIYTSGMKKLEVFAVLDVHQGAAMTITKDFVGPGGIIIGEMFAQETLSTSSINKSENSGFVGPGRYMFHTYSDCETPVVVYSILTTTETIPEFIQIPLNDFVYVSDDSEERSFTFSATGGPLQLSIYGPMHYLVTISDADGNVILSRHDAGLYSVTQNFSAGNYKIVVERLSEEEQIIVYINDTIQENYGYLDASLIDIDGAVSIDLIPGFSWYKFEVTEAGYYTLEEISSESESVRSAFFTSTLKTRTTDYNFYFETGTNYIKIDGYGTYVFTLTKDEVIIPTTNNTKLTATTIAAETQDIYSYFDGTTTEKWYQFEVVSDMSMKFVQSIVLYGKNPTFTLYNASGKELESGSTSLFVTAKMPVGEYYLRITGNKDSGVTTSIIASPLVTYSVDPSNATPITIESKLDGISLRGQTSYFDLTITTSGYYSFYYDGLWTTLDIDTIEYTLQTYAPIFIYLEAGVHKLALEHSYADFEFELSFSKATNITNPEGKDYAIAGVHSIYTNTLVLVKDELVRFTDRVLVEETAVYAIQPYNANYVTVYDCNGEVVVEGGAYSIYGFVLTPGVYTIEYTSEGKGFISTGLEVSAPLLDYSKTMTNVTIVDKMTDLNGYFGNESMDTIKVTIPHDMLLHVQTNKLVQLVILDENKDFVTSSGYDFNDSSFVELTEGDYYFIINRGFYNYYYINLIDVTEDVVSNDIENPTPVLIGNSKNTFMLKEIQLESFLTFTLDFESVLDITILSGESFEIYDMNGNIHTLPYYAPGDYIVKVYSTSYTVETATHAKPLIIDIKNVTSEITENTKETAKDIQKNVKIDARRPLPGMSTWYKFTVVQDELIMLTRTSLDGFKLYDEASNIVPWPDSYKSLPTGDYYIQIVAEEVAHSTYYALFSVKVLSKQYIDAPSLCSEATPYELHSGVATIYGHMLSDQDIDCYKFDINNVGFMDYYMSTSAFTYERVDANGQFIRSINSSTYEVIRGEQYIYVTVHSGAEGDYTLYVYNKVEQLTPDSFAEAREIALGEYVTAYRETVDEDDYYSFYLDEVITIGTTYYQPSAFTLYDAQMSEVLDYSTPLPIGQYYLKFNNSSAGIYSFRFLKIFKGDGQVGEKEEIVPGFNSFDEPINLNSRYFTLFANETEGYYSTDYYQLTLLETTHYSIDGDYGDTRIYIYDDQMQEVTLISDMKYTPYVVSLKPGTYYLQVTQANDYKVDFEALDFIDYSNDEDNPNEISMYETINSYIFGTEDIDYLTLTLDEEKIIEFNQRFEIKIRVYNQAGDLLMNTHESTSIARLEAGTYDIHVTTLFNIPVEYEWYIDELVPMYTTQTIEEAPTITIESEFTTGTFFAEVPGENVYVKLLIEEFTVIDELQGMYLCDLKGDNLYEYRLQPGTYLLKLVGHSHFFSFRDITQYYYLTNTTKPEIQIGQEINIKAVHGDDIAMFTFTAPRDMLVYFSKTWEQFDYFIKDENDITIYSGMINASTYDIDHFLFEENKTYTMQIDNYTEDINIRFEEYLFVDHPDLQADAYNLEYDTTIAGEIFNITDDDWFTFNATEQTILFLSGVNYTMYNPDSSVVLHNAGESDSIIVEAGTYFVRVHGATSYPYTIEIQKN